HEHLLERIAQGQPQIDAARVGIGDQGCVADEIHAEATLRADVATGMATARAPADLVGEFLGQAVVHAMARLASAGPAGCLARIRVRRPHARSRSAVRGRSRYDAFRTWD